MATRKSMMLNQDQLDELRESFDTVSIYQFALIIH